MGCVFACVFLAGRLILAMLLAGSQAGCRIGRSGVSCLDGCRIGHIELGLRRRRRGYVGVVVFRIMLVFFVDMFMLMLLIVMIMMPGLTRMLHISVESFGVVRWA